MTTMKVITRDLKEGEQPSLIKPLNDEINISYDVDGNVIGIEFTKPWAYFVNRNNRHDRYDLVENQVDVSQDILDQILELGTKTFEGHDVILEKTDREFEIVHLWKLRVKFDWDKVTPQEGVEKLGVFYRKLREKFPNLHPAVIGVITE